MSINFLGSAAIVSRSLSTREKLNDLEKTSTVVLSLEYYMTKFCVHRSWNYGLKSMIASIWQINNSLDSRISTLIRRHSKYLMSINSFNNEFK